MSERIVIAGLGNPGKRYEQTRHNIGFLFLDRFVDSFGRGPAGAAEWREKDDALSAEFTLGTRKVVAVKPQTYMNCSGDPLQKIVGFYKVAVEDLVVVHDEVDLPFLTLRLKQGGGEAGHNGLRSVTSRLGSKNYLRLRLGVGRPQSVEDRPAPEVHDWVLGSFSSEEQRELPEFLDRAGQALEMVFREGVKSAQNRFHES